MALAPVVTMKKDEIVWLSRHKCEHGHSFLSHYQCYLRENPLKEKIGYFDIEASNLNANFGIIFTYCIKTGGKDEILERTVTKKELSTCLDKKVVEQCVKDLQKYDKIIGYYSARFDIPYVRSRALYNGLDFPAYGEIIHEDLYDNIKRKFRLNSNRLETACRFLLGHSDKTHLNSDYWIKALQGDKESLDYIVDHCRKDVIDLEKLHKRVEIFKKKSHTSA